MMAQKSRPEEISSGTPSRELDGDSEMYLAFKYTAPDFLGHTLLLVMKGTSCCHLAIITASYISLEKREYFPSV